MKLKYIFLILLNCSVILGQGSLDSLINKNKEIDSAKVFLIYEYKLPEWGYSRFYFNLYGTLSENDRSGQNRAFNDLGNSIHLNPYFYKYLESEKLISSILISSVIGYSGQQQTVERESDTTKSKYYSHNTNLYTEASFTYYADSKWFMHFGTNNYFQYRENQSELIQLNNGQKSIFKNELINRYYRSLIRIGGGYGRIRNVTSVFRALRFNEKIKSLNGKTQLNTDDLQELSHFFTRKNSYGQIYQRSDKYFYSDLPKTILNSITGMAPWEIMYIDEVWDEILGDRFEGFEVSGGLLINYDKIHNSNPDAHEELFLYGLYIDQKFYHNINPYYQIGTGVYCSLSKVINEKTPYNFLGNGSLRILNLWNLTDRMLIELDFGIETGFASGSGWERVDNYFTDFTLRYFLEDNLSFDMLIFYNYDRNWPQNLSFAYDGKNYNNSSYNTEKGWTIQFNLRYYLSQGLY
jgi:hypothetical protein